MSLRLGIRENLAQFSLLVAVNALVGAMVGSERSVLPGLASDEFGMGAHASALSFIASFGIAKAVTNLYAGLLCDIHGRKRVLLLGWLLGLPVPVLLLLAPSWGYVVAANALLGVSQGFAWSTTVVMKIDLAGPRRRGLAMGLNEAAGYGAVALAAWGTGNLAGDLGARNAVAAVATGAAVFGLLLSAFAVRETQGHARFEGRLGGNSGHERIPLAVAVRRTSLDDPTLQAACQAGLVNNLNDGAAWGLFPLVYAAAGLDLPATALLVATYPAVWGVGQLFTGALADRYDRRSLVTLGMLVQALGLVATVAGPGVAGFAIGAVLLGVGTALVYPTLLAIVGDAAPPAWRASAVGVYRLWRDLGYAAGAIGAGLAADALGMEVAVFGVAALTAASGAFAGARMRRASEVVAIERTSEEAPR